MKRLICKIFGHKDEIEELSMDGMCSVKCRRCGSIESYTNAALISGWGKRIRKVLGVV